MQTVVINNRESLVIGQMPHTGKDTAGIPQLGPTVTLIPGVNLIDSKMLETLRKNAAFDAHFKTRIESSPAPEQNPEKVGKFILVQGKEVEDKSPLAKLPEKACEAMIEETLSATMLKSWLTEEGRGEIRRLIENKLTKLQTGATVAGGPAAADR